MTAYPITVPLHVAAALRPGETAECDLDTGEWYAVAGHGRRELRRPLPSRVREMSPHDDALLDDMRRFYERGCAAC